MHNLLGNESLQRPAMRCRGAGPAGGPKHPGTGDATISEWPPFVLVHFKTNAELSDYSQGRSRGTLSIQSVKSINYAGDSRTGTRKMNGYPPGTAEPLAQCRRETEAPSGGGGGGGG